jgi:uncharacterized protein (TIGR03083 family)
VEIPRLIETLRSDGELLARAAEHAGVEAAVPTCPDWVVRDLVRHQGGVHRWATAYVRDRRTELWRVDLEEVAGGWPADDELVAWFRDGHRALVAALEGADAALECWTFLPAPSPLAMWARRQAHETAVHRVDAELAAGGAASPVDAAFAADGIDELLTCFVPRPTTGLRADPPVTLRVRPTDAAGRWLLRIGPDGVEAAAGAAATGDVDCEAAGPAADLYLALWNRRGTDGLSVEGDGGVLGLFLSSVHIRGR